MANVRSVIHIYIPSFHASLEQQRNPELAGRPVMVTHVSGKTAFVVSASPDAKLEGVREGMTSRHARRYCQSSVLLHADWGLYKEVSEKVLEILSKYTPLLEPQGLDRAYLDVTASRNLFGSPESIAREAGRRIMKGVGLPCAIGIASNKFVARAATERCSPGRILRVESGREGEFLSPLSISHLPGVGPKNEKRLLTLGVRTIGDLAAIPENMLVRQFGSQGSKLHNLAIGMDYSPVLPMYPPDIITAGQRFDFEEPCEAQELDPYIIQLCDSAAMEIASRNRKAGMASVVIQLIDGTVHGDSCIPKSPIASSCEIYSAVSHLILPLMDGCGVESISIVLSDLSAMKGVQLSLLGDMQSSYILRDVFARLHSRFGPNSITYGSSMNAEV